MRIARHYGAITVLCLCIAAPAWGVQMEKGPAYLTDSHGAAGVAQSFLELAKTSPEYARYWKGSLDWLLYVAQRDEEGRMTWLMSTSAPKGHPSRRISIPGICHVSSMFFAGYEACGDARYKSAGIAGARMIVERYAIKKQTSLGTSYAWTHAYQPNAKVPGMLAGHSHGLGNVIDALLKAHEASPSKEFKQALKGLVINLRLRGRQMEKDGQVMFAWPTVKNPRVFESGYCYGQAGVLLPLLSLAEAMPRLKLSDGTTPLSMANANLKYLMSVAREQNGGYVWPYMRHSETSRNIGYGSGTGGIGWAMLRGSQINRDIDPDFAAKCMHYARGAVLYALNLVESAKGNQRMRGPGGDVGFGVCGGAGGAGYFLMLYADGAGKEDTLLVRRIGAAVEKIARSVISSGVELEDGTMACPDRVNFKCVNLALDYGQTGVVLGLSTAGRYLQNQEINDAAERVADYIVRRAVDEGGGQKFAQFHPLPSSQKALHEHLR